jgi:hypothetical protein
MYQVQLWPHGRWDQQKWRLVAARNEAEAAYRVTGERLSEEASVESYASVSGDSEIELLQPRPFIPLERRVGQVAVSQKLAEVPHRFDSIRHTLPLGLLHISRH